MGTLVVGMHRSGTSLLTALLVDAGGRLCRADDVMGAAPDNPEGFFESRSLADFDESLLSGAGGTWSAPPTLTVPWLVDRLDHRRAEAADLFAAAFPDAGWVWKDPRLCLLLPFWRQVLAGPLAAVLVWRSPGEVAASLEGRDGLEPAHGRRLWRHHHLVGLVGLTGLPVFVTAHSDVVRDPVATTAKITEFLSRHDALVPVAVDEERLAARVRADLVHHRSEIDPDDPDADVVELLRSLAGPHESFDPGHLPADHGAPAARVWTDGLVIELGRRDRRIAELEAELAELDAQKRALDTSSAPRRSWLRR